MANYRHLQGARTSKENFSSLDNARISFTYTRQSM
jgi:hypothetical protein